tara:strand:- start:2532 stop:3395 length:864 start_codon:yes stop_codon:yes gene_type:complete
MFYRKYGPDKVNLSIVGLGGIVVKDTSLKESENIINFAYENGVNYFDVAPGYGNAQELMGPGINKIRDNVFLACKTNKRDSAGSENELNDSLSKLKTDYFDLYQLHGMKTEDDFLKVSSTDGALKTLFKAKKDGRVKHIGFSCHSVKVANLLLDNFEFDSILFPVNWALILKNNFGTEVIKKCNDNNVSVLALKCMASELWGSDDRGEFQKCWYRPLSDKDFIEMAIKFTLSKKVVSFLPPGNERLFKLAIEIVNNDLEKITDDEIKFLKEQSKIINPIGSSEEVHI